MSLRCPLCLESLAQGVTFYRFCPRHPRAVATFTISNDDYSGIYCQDGECQPQPSILADNVFLLHDGCRCLNPYWDGAALALNRPVTFLRPIVNPPPGQAVASRTVTVTHWELGILRQIAAVYPGHPHMWFPQILFRAVNENWRSRPFGALTILVGAQGCGKTVLSVMAMNRDAFSQVIGDNYVNDHFVHVTQSSSGFSEHLLKTLDALDVFGGGRPPADFVAAQQILPTPESDLSNLKSAYFWPTSSPSRRDAGDEDMSVGGFLLHVGKKFAPVRATSTPQGARLPTHLVLAMHDTAGELWKKGDVKLLSLRAEADTTAIVLDATSLDYFKNVGMAQSPDSAAIARKWLENTAGAPARRCLVVTKLDVLQANADVQKHMDAVRHGENVPVAPRELLLRWLSEAIVPEQRIKRQLQRDLNLEVFFVWTEGLTTPGVIPTAYGVEDFVSWCLDIGRWLKNPT